MRLRRGGGVGGPVVAVNIPIGLWHTVRALESGTVIMEVKDGAYEPIGPEDILELGIEELLKNLPVAALDHKGAGHYSSQ